ncbi:DUF1853 family protein [Trinickia symbiotica]|uniref:DUF1853 domain-containing protein n=1 Tax=Trinickia symbiotica TaxID=863227 RepID=A0A2N7X0V6_9BURK|nr:DUF1853 family protein [Trinickia symbiotica]PMS35211.1 DUF1853 domain-containing protein [Trinickia symbiotica]
MNALEPADRRAVLEALLAELHDDAVRDLAWLLFSPPLLREQPPLGMLVNAFETADEVAATEAWLLALDRDSDPLRQTLATSRLTRLGRYAECLLAYFLAHGPATRLIAANVALRLAGRTVGECDFLVETASGRRQHWELAVKCYLHLGGESASLADYVGPNLQDRFDVKLARLLEHQLPLSARDEFASLGHAGPWEAQMLVKGWLFYRWREDAPVRNVALPQLHPQAVDPLHARGFWITRAQWPRFAGRFACDATRVDNFASHSAIEQSSRLSLQRADAWAILPRLAWLAPRRSSKGDGAQAAGLSTAQALAERLAQHDDPTMVAAFVRAEGDAGSPHWRESARGFVVPDDWPERACAFAGRPYHQR